MSASLPSDEVAEDYKNALDDLVTNDRYQIINLTMIAKENIEHAEAISRVLINHINRTSPPRKLPALYVLDSLVKNIGSPYTVYFGRNLHSTFMLAYSQVDPAIRRKLEEMLRTWREPIPGSQSPTPVFPLQSTQSIVDALNKHRASTTPLNQRNQPTALQHSRIPSVQPYRNTPTPPQTTISHHVPASEAHIRSPAPQFSVPGHGQGGSGYPSMVLPPSVPKMVNNSVDLAELHADIDNLTTDAKIECATRPMDLDAQRKLTTLQTLKELLDAGSASEQDLFDIKKTVKHELEKKAMSQAPLVQIQSLPQQPIYPPSHSIPAQSSSTPVPPLPFLNQASLAELLRATSAVRETPPPPIQYSNAYQQPPVTSYSTPPPIYNNQQGPPPIPPPPGLPAGAFSFLDQLRASGLLSTTPTPAQATNQTTGLPSLLMNGNTNIQRTSASLRIPRPHMVKNFLDERPNQCSTCGKRFTSDVVGKERKARHLDWHFKTKARMLEAEKRGQNRSWYTDAREWIVSKGFDDELVDDEAATGAASATTNTQRTQDFVRAPTDPTLRNAPCPIDQEPFKSEWSEEVQDFIWKDAIRVGNRYYHASCYREATKDRDKDGVVTSNTNGTARTATPDSVLGKRKAEMNIEGNIAARVKLET